MLFAVLDSIDSSFGQELGKNPTEPAARAAKFAAELFDLWKLNLPGCENNVLVVLVASERQVPQGSRLFQLASWPANGRQA